MTKIRKFLQKYGWKTVEMLVGGLIISLIVKWFRPQDPFVIQYVFGVVTYWFVIKPTFSNKEKEQKK